KGCFEIRRPKEPRPSLASLCGPPLGTNYSTNIHDIRPRFSLKAGQASGKGTPCCSRLRGRGGGTGSGAVGPGGRVRRGFVADGHKRFSLFGLRRKMGSFGIFHFRGPLGGAGAPAPPESMVARRVRRPGRNRRKFVESRGDRDLEFGKWVRES